MLESVDEVLETMRIEEEPPINDEIQPIETFVDLKLLLTSKALKLYTHYPGHQRPIACSNI